MATWNVSILLLNALFNRRLILVFSDHAGIATQLQVEKALIAEISALAAGFILLLFVLVRQLWRQTIKDPKSKDKFCRMGRTLSNVLGRG